MLLQWLYQFLWQIAPFFLRRYLRRRSKQLPAYAEHWHERFGSPYANPVRDAIWIHAVSVGETRAAAPLIAELRHYFPNAPLLLTQTTPTGRATAESLYSDAQCRYLPYDKHQYVSQFLQDHRPRFGILMETEIWPNLIRACRTQNTPLFLANARLSEKSQQGYLKILGLVRPAMQQLSLCCAQTENDAARLKSIGAQHVLVCGNSKYDIAPPDAMHTLAHTFRQRIGSRPVVVCASTRFYHKQDEAQLLLNAWQTYHGNALLVIIPRHPERFQAAFDAAVNLGFKTQKRSDNQAVRSDTQVWIGDSMGELFAYYLCADVAFVGGSLVDSGSQNMIEPIACGVPTLFGMSTYHFAHAAAYAVDCGAAQQVRHAEDWLQAVQFLLTDTAARQQMRIQAASFILAHRGASRRMAEAITQHLNKQQ
ncbi:lipid IV(A) 3-deoxy-D-manno-octulosonic acid transferase [Stenoxybacter acetivorans]|uniref:lipid IV(A) 3-deoxy-D-manno-octulosonic acid transferase n=1 Tax=Stenoxybacter acetivorans TaxID=422441 RepID=UPI00056C75BA|nr:lipid IV(A) 3-deoxy-D-manno-octulosonic acid transferase [Stenoxybacter acetivorans]